MENDASVKELVEFIFSKHVTNSSEIIAPNSSIPTCLLTQEFSKNMQYVVFMRRNVIFCKWQNSIDKSFDNLLSSHEMYLKSVMFGCLSEYERSQNIFDSLIDVCAFVKLLSDETLGKTGVDFSDLNPDIIMAFYDSVLKRNLCRSGGFHQLEEYIRGHRYLAWNCHRNFVFPGDPTAPVNFIELDFAEKLVNEVCRDIAFQADTNSDAAAKCAICISLAQKVLSTTSVELPTLPSYPDLIMRLVASREKETTKNAESNRMIYADGKAETLHGCSSSNSDSITNFATKRKENIARYENIIQAVISHNHSKSPGHVKSEGRIQREAGGTLEHLKSTIKSLIEVLDEFDKE